MVPRTLVGLLLAAAAASPAEILNDKVGILDPFPREVLRGKTLVIKGAVKAPFKNPQLILIAPGGKTYLNKDNQIAGLDFTFNVRFDEGVGPYRLELIATGPTATRTAARFTVWYGQKKPAEEEAEPPPTGPKTPLTIHERLLEKRFAVLLNAFRKGIGCEPVGWNEAVAARAREHAARMAEAQRKQHRFGTVGGVLEMLQRDGAGESGLSGPATPWGRLTSRRPFDRPAPQPPGPRVWNHGRGEHDEQLARGDVRALLRPGGGLPHLCRGPELRRDRRGRRAHAAAAARAGQGEGHRTPPGPPRLLLHLLRPGQRDPHDQGAGRLLR
jgi:hypothetical protein